MMNNIKNNFIVSGFYGNGVLTLLSTIAMGAMILSPINAFAQSAGQNVIYGDPNANTYNTNYNSQPANPTPYISSITPTSASLYVARTITVYGGGFNSQSVIRIDGVNQNTYFANSGTLSTQVNFGSSAAIGTHSVTVYNPAPGGGTSNTAYMSVNSGTVAGASTSVAKAKTSTTNTKTVASKTSTASVQDTTDNNDFSNLAGNALFGTNSFMPSGLMQWILFAILILLIVIITRKIFVGDKERNKPLKHA